jgi:hypothetical protein
MRISTHAPLAKTSRMPQRFKGVRGSYLELAGLRGQRAYVWPDDLYRRGQRLALSSAILGECPESLGGLGDRNPEGMAPSGQKKQPYAVVQHHGHGGLLAFAVGQFQKALRIGDGEFLPPALDDTL